MKLSEVWENYCTDKKIEGFSSATLKMYGYQHNLLQRYLGDLQAEEVTADELKSYLAEAAEYLKPSSLGHRVRFVRSLFRWAHEEGIIRKNPAAKLKEPKAGKRVPKFLTKQDIEYLREACRTAKEKAIFEFFYSTGCRIGEVAALDRLDIDFGTNSVIVRGKGDREREVYFSIRCAIWLKRSLQERSDSEPCLFTTTRKPIRRMSIDSLRYVIRQISERSVLTKTIHPHQLRHSYATHMIDNGAPLEVIQSLLGHEKSETTKIYAQLSGKLRYDLYNRYFP
ncbi:MULTISPECIES: tyrosine-type recombinase/integrase [Sporosarcina]|uniref:tyrosine-type recombinase/integrase n=1 Tax=Sporosarcina TaxID=1569 RepID=UPI000590C655|nr:MULTISPECIES: tyrosine-type recombinase/integrase [Sporosarcina]WJY27066.1 tyrosine-type recombinase/integrase [Sporosarcina sp. 0.2-SM1T-5]